MENILAFISGSHPKFRLDLLHDFQNSPLLLDDLAHEFFRRTVFQGIRSKALS